MGMEELLPGLSGDGCNFCSRASLCISGFVNDVMFPNNTANVAESKMTLCFVEFARWRHRWQSLLTRLPFQNTVQLIEESDSSFALEAILQLTE